jgi:hypothetical protein
MYLLRRSDFRPLERRYRHEGREMRTEYCSKNPRGRDHMGYFGVDRLILYLQKWSMQVWGELNWLCSWSSGRPSWTRVAWTPGSICAQNLLHIVGLLAQWTQKWGGGGRSRKLTVLGDTLQKSQQKFLSNYLSSKIFLIKNCTVNLALLDFGFSQLWWWITRLLGLRVRIPTRAWMSVAC